MILHYRNIQTAFFRVFLTLAIVFTAIPTHAATAAQPAAAKPAAAKPATAAKPAAAAAPRAKAPEVAPATAIQATAGPARETRAIWITRWDYASPADIRKIMRNAAGANFNVALFQVRGEATVFYPSKVEPWAWELTSKTPASTGQDPGWDPLATAITEAHAAGLELHAWMNVLPVWKQTSAPPRAVNHLLLRPELLLFNRAGKPMPINDFYTFANPANPEVKSHLQAVFAELATKYQLDGVTLDYIRFPDEFEDGDLGYDPQTIAAFKKQFGVNPSQYPEAWNAFRGQQVNDVVRMLYTTVKQRQPNLIFSAACVADYRKATQECHQHSLEWLNDGYMDCLMPMNYTAKMDVFDRRMETFMTERKRGMIVSALWLEGGAAPLVQEVQRLREIGAHGVSVFSYGSLFPGNEANAIAAYLKKSVFANKATVYGRVASDG